MPHVDIDPFEIEPLHEPRIPALLSELIEGMRANGWQGRPLLVIETATGYVAWTGSHRIAAARAAELPTVPCYALHESKIIRAGADREIDARYGHVEDGERLDIIRKTRDEVAINLMWQEGRH